MATLSPNVISLHCTEFGAAKTAVRQATAEVF